jgi:hypothetical protein
VGDVPTGGAFGLGDDVGRECAHLLGADGGEQHVRLGGIGPSYRSVTSSPPFSGQGFSCNTLQARSSARKRLSRPSESRTKTV